MEGVSDQSDEEMEKNENGDEESSEEVFTGGHGFMNFSDDPLSLTWQEDQEHVADDMVFNYAN